MSEQENTKGLSRVCFSPKLLLHLSKLVCKLADMQPESKHILFELSLYISALLQNFGTQNGDHPTAIPPQNTKTKIKVVWRLIINVHNI